jgi:hypothetical protein
MVLTNFFDDLKVVDCALGHVVSRILLGHIKSLVRVDRSNVVPFRRVPFNFSFNRLDRQPP